MRKLLAFVAAALLAGWGTLQTAKGEVTVDVFYQSLEPHGEWMETADYGYVWHPRDVAEGWRPYTVGNWVYTDAGWTWVSEEPFGWATYHYGRWIEIDQTGWVWIPDTEWGPAWVSWRRSPKYVGWAPLPPEATFRRTVGIKTWSDAYYDVGPTYYSFVEVRQFGAPDLATVILPPRENVTIIRETRNITNITVVNNIVFNGGPEYDVIVRESVQPIRRLRLERRTDVDFDRARPDAFRPRIAGDSLQFAAPDIRYVPDAKPARVAKKLERVEADRGWKDLQNREQAQQLRAAIKQEAKPPAELPPQPKFQRLAERDEANRAEREAASAVPGTEDAAKSGRAGDRRAAGREGPMKDAATAETPDAAAPATPGAPATPEAKAGTAKDEETRAAERARPGGERPGREGAAATEEERKKKPATTPKVGAKPGESERPEGMRKPAERPDRTGAGTPESLTPPTDESSAAPARKEPPKTPSADQPSVEEKPDRPSRARDRGEKPAQAEKEEAAGKKAKPSPRTREPGAAEVPDVSTERGPARSESAPATSPERSERPQRPEREESSSPVRRAVPAARMPESATRPEQAERPERSQPREQPQRPARPERPEPQTRQGGGAAAQGGERPSRPERPDAAGGNARGRDEQGGPGRGPGARVKAQ